MNKRNGKNSLTKNIALAGMCLALALLLPFLTGQIPQIGSALCPMHLPVLLAGFACGPLWGAIVGLIAPILRYLLWGMPPIFPTGVAMAFELATYALVAGLVYGWLKKNTVNVYVSLIAAMIVGRLVWGLVMLVIMGLTNGQFSLAIFFSAVVLTSLPGIALQIILIPLIVIGLRKAELIA